MLGIPNAIGLKKVLQAHVLASEARPNFNAHIVKTRRPEANCGIARKAEAFTGNAHEGVELLVGIRVMKDREGIASRRHAPEFDDRLGSRHGLDQCVRIGSAIGEVASVSGQAGVNDALASTQARHVDVNGRGGSCRGDQRRGKQESDEFAHRPEAYQPLSVLTTAVESCAE